MFWWLKSFFLLPNPWNCLSKDPFLNRRYTIVLRHQGGAAPSQSLEVFFGVGERHISGLLFLAAAELTMKWIIVTLDTDVHSADFFIVLPTLLLSVIFWKVLDGLPWHLVWHSLLLVEYWVTMSNDSRDPYMFHRVTLWGQNVHYFGLWWGICQTHSHHSHL